MSALADGERADAILEPARSGRVERDPPRAPRGCERRCQRVRTAPDVLDRLLYRRALSGRGAGGGGSPAAPLPALRAARMSAAQAIATGMAPVTGRGRTVAGLMATLPLPRSITLGSSDAFARPLRSLTAVSAIAFGVAATFALGLSSSLQLVKSSLERTQQVPVESSLVAARKGSSRLDRQPTCPGHWRQSRRRARRRHRQRPTPRSGASDSRSRCGPTAAMPHGPGTASSTAAGSRVRARRWPRRRSSPERAPMSATRSR